MNIKQDYKDLESRKEKSEFRQLITFLSVVVIGSIILQVIL